MPRNEMKLRQTLKMVFDDSDVNAMQVWYGWNIYTNLRGWHYRRFGQSQAVYLGCNIRESIDRLYAYDKD